MNIFVAKRDRQSFQRIPKKQPWISRALGGQKCAPAWHCVACSFGWSMQKRVCNGNGAVGPENGERTMSQWQSLLYATKMLCEHLPPKQVVLHVTCVSLQPTVSGSMWHLFSRHPHVCAVVVDDYASAKVAKKYCKTRPHEQNPPKHSMSIFSDSYQAQAKCCGKFTPKAGCRAAQRISSGNLSMLDRCLPSCALACILHVAGK